MSDDQVGFTAPDDWSVNQGFHDSYARFQCIDDYPNQPEIVAYAMTDVETVEMNALEAYANEEARTHESQAAFASDEYLYDPILQPYDDQFAAGYPAEYQTSNDGYSSRSMILFEMIAQDLHRFVQFLTGNPVNHQDGSGR